MVVDLTSLWAGPLCGALLADAGARVVKVESAERPDGARAAAPPRSSTCSTPARRAWPSTSRTPSGAGAAAALLVRRADVVLEAARPRALEQLGIRRDEVMATGGPQVWLSITAHGRTGPERERVGFGDDAAVAGGLVVTDADGPCFCADAVADPATGLTAAVAVAEALAGGGRWTLDVALASVAATLAGPTLPDRCGGRGRPTPGPAPPRGRPPPRRRHRRRPRRPGPPMTAVPEVVLGDVEVDGRRVDVVLGGGQVEAIVGAGEAGTSGVEVVAGAGGALLPGLHDHHLHLLAMAAATTSVSGGTGRRRGP